MNKREPLINGGSTLGQPCPVCASICITAQCRLFCKYGYWILGCRRCGHRFAEFTPTPQHPLQVYGDDYFLGGKAGYPDYLAEAKILRQHGLRYARLLRRYMQPGVVLDVGAAAGFILQGLEDGGWQGYGLEPNPQMATYACTHLGLAVEAGTLEQWQSDRQYDLITMIQVIAHFYDLQQALQVASSRTKLGGFWLIETWNWQSLTARVLGSHWHEYSPPSVLHWFSPNELRQLAGQFGFQEVGRGRPVKWLNGAHAKSLLHYKLMESSWTAWITRLLKWVPDDLQIPYPADDLVWMLFQKRPLYSTSLSRHDQ